jgi:hypothetical protein
VIEVPLVYRMISDMRPALLFLAIISSVFLSGCASGPNDPDQVQLGPSIKEQRQEARKTEDFARSLPPPHS